MEASIARKKIQRSWVAARAVDTHRTVGPNSDYEEMGVKLKTSTNWKNILHGDYTHQKTPKYKISWNFIKNCGHSEVLKWA